MSEDTKNEFTAHVERLSNVPVTDDEDPEKPVLYHEGHYTLSDGRQLTTFHNSYFDDTIKDMVTVTDFEINAQGEPYEVEEVLSLDFAGRGYEGRDWHHSIEAGDAEREREYGLHTPDPDMAIEWFGGEAPSDVKEADIDRQVALGVMSLALHEERQTGINSVSDAEVADMNRLLASIQ